jgi:polyhydroxyalkanoate synthesis regulator phasin
MDIAAIRKKVETGEDVSLEEAKVLLEDVVRETHELKQKDPQRYSEQLDILIAALEDILSSEKSA